ARAVDVLLTHPGAASPLEHIVRLALHLVGAVDREIDPLVLGKTGERDPELARLCRAPPRGRNPNNRETLGDTGCQLLDKKGGGRAGAESKHHAVLDKIEGALGGGAFQPVAILHQPSPSAGGAEWRIAAIAAP